MLNPSLSPKLRFKKLLNNALGTNCRIFWCRGIYLAYTNFLWRYSKITPRNYGVGDTMLKGLITRVAEGKINLICVTSFLSSSNDIVRRNLVPTFFVLIVLKFELESGILPLLILRKCKTGYQFLSKIFY